MLRGWQHNQHGGPMTVVAALSSAEDAFAVRPQNLETTIFTSADQENGLVCRVRRRVDGRRWVAEILSQRGPRRSHKEFSTLEPP
jgi:hypothetical protein